tara:strand:- start:295 stop:1137 length:843 start_codon:yes stop_codon:yes gene_type:complete
MIDKNNEINKFTKKIWLSLEKQPYPTTSSKIRTIDYNSFKNIFLDLKKIEEIINCLFKGEIFIIKKAFDLEFIEKLKFAFNDFTEKNESTFYKLKEGCPNFHRIIDEKASSSYSIKAIKHSAYFFPWNEDEYKMFEEINERWRFVKLLGGRKFDEFEKNTPKDGVIDRLQILNYPAGGELELHSDPFHNQRMFISIYMSKRGKDYKEGGFYAMDENNQEIDIESFIDEGDLGIGYATIRHGVKKITDVEGSNAKRWFLGLYSNDSDEIKNRKTTMAIKNN